MVLCFYQMFCSIVINSFIILSVYTVCSSVLSVYLLIVFCLFWRINVGLLICGAKGDCRISPLKQGKDLPVEEN